MRGKSVVECFFFKNVKIKHLITRIKIVNNRCGWDFYQMLSKEKVGQPAVVHYTMQSGGENHHVHKHQTHLCCRRKKNTKFEKKKSPKYNSFQ